MKSMSEAIRSLAGIALLVGLVGGLYFKSRAIDEMHDGNCRVDCVAFSALSAQSVPINRGIAWAYYACEFAVWGGGGILVFSQFLKRSK